MKKIIAILFAISTISLLWCTKAPKVEIGDKVTISYTWTFEDATIFETSTKTIIIWSGDIIKWIEEAIIGKKSGKSVTTSITPEKWYGNQYSIYNKQRVSAFIFDKLWLSTETGAMVTLDKITWKVLGQEKDKEGNTIIIFDVNPPQTRQDISYEIIIENIEKNTTEYTL